MKFEPSDLEQIAQLVTERVLAAIADRLAIASNPTPHKAIWTEAEAAEQLGISRWTLRTYRLGGYVAATSIKRPILYSRDDIAAAMQYLRSRGSS